MAYTDKNYKTKKELISDVKAGKIVGVHQPNGDITGGSVPDNGTVYLEGPHYPKPHRWYAVGTMKDGRLVAVK